MVFRAGSKYFDTEKKPLIMGILNVTPDSFSDGGKYAETGKAVARALEMIDEGADIIDVGGESTRPGSSAVPAVEEAARIIPVIKGIRRVSDICISADTYKPEVARAALGSGADMINCVKGSDPGEELLGAAASYGAGLCLMHMRGEPGTMQDYTEYWDIVREISDILSASYEKALKYGVRSESLVLDPGIGFGKSAEGSLTLIRCIGELKKTGRPVLAGLSRKSFIGTILGAGTGERLYGTLAASVAAYIYGADIFRVHDVKAHADALSVARAIKSQKSEGDVK